MFDKSYIKTLLRCNKLKIHKSFLKNKKKNNRVVIICFQRLFNVGIVRSEAKQSRNSCLD